MSPTEKGTPEQKGLESPIKWADLVNDLQKILSSAQKNPSNNAFAADKLHPFILKFANQGKIASIRELIKPAYFTPAEIEKIKGELDAYAGEISSTTPIVKKEEHVETKKEHKQHIKQEIATRKKKRKANESSFQEVEKTTDELKKIEFPEGTTNLGTSSTSEAKIVETPKNEIKIEEPVVEEKKQEPIIIPVKEEPVIPVIEEKTETDKSNLVETSYSSRGDKNLPFANLSQALKNAEPLKQEKKKELVVKTKPIPKIETPKTEIKKVEKKPTIEDKKVRMPDEDTLKRLDAVIKKEKNSINAFLENKDLPIVTHENPDLDSKVAIYFLQILGGAKNKEIKYIKKGVTAEKGVLIDVGDVEDLISVNKKRVVFDHHFPDRWVETSSSEIMLESLKRLDRIKKIEPWMREFANFVTEVDNMSYKQNGTEWFEKNYAKTILGLREYIPVEKMAELFKSGKSQYDVLSDEELKTLTYKNQKGEERPLQEASAREAYKVNKDIKNAQWHDRNNARNGLRLYTHGFGKMLYNDRTNDKDHKISLGAHAAYNMKYDTYETWDPQRSGYFISAPGKNLIPFWNRLKIKDPSALPVRASMILNYPDAEKKSAGTKLKQYEYERLLGMTVSEKNVATAVEYQVLGITKGMDQRNITNYKIKLAETELNFRKAQLLAEKSLNVFMVELDSIRGATDKEIVKRKNMLEAKTAALTEEIKIWGDKLKILTSLPKDKPKLYGTLVNKDNFKIEPKSASKAEIKNIKPVLDLDDEETYNAEFAKLTKKDLELVLLDLGWPNEEIEKRDMVDLAGIIDRQEKYVTPEELYNNELSNLTKKDLELVLSDLGWPKEEIEQRDIKDLAGIIDRQEKYVAPTIQEAPKQTLEDVENTAEVLRQEKLNKLFAEKNVIEAKLATFSGTEKEHMDLITNHYNTWNMGLYIQNGEKGETPKALTYQEILAIRIEKKKSEEPVKETIETNNPLGIIGSGKDQMSEEEFADFSAHEAELKPLNELDQQEKIKILAEQNTLYQAKDFYQRQFKKFNLEDNNYCLDANSKFEKILSEQIEILNKSKYAEYHKEFYEECKNLLVAGEIWYEENRANKKTNPTDLFDKQEDSIKNPEYSIKEFRQEILEAFDLAEIKGSKIKNLAHMKDLILESRGSELTMSVEIEPNLGVGMLGMSSASFLGTFKNTPDSITFENYMLDGGGEYTDELKKYFENIGSAIKDHLEIKLKMPIEKIQVKNGKLEVIFK